MNTVTLEPWRGRIVDAHAHLGDCRVFGSSVSADDLIETIESTGLGRTLVMPYPGEMQPENRHDEIAELSSRLPGRIHGIANISPHRPKKAYLAEVTRCVRDLGFVALKLHTVGHAVDPTSEDGRTVFEAAQNLGVPVIVHTGPGVPFSLPALCLPAATAMPELKIVLAHGGHTMLFQEALVCAQLCPNIFIETSWLGAKQVSTAIRLLGAEKVMAGSDGTFNVGPMLGMYANIGLPQDQLEAVLVGTATQVFALDASTPEARL